MHAIAFMQREIQEAAYRYQQEVEAQARAWWWASTSSSWTSRRPRNLFQVDPGARARSPSASTACARRGTPATAARALEAVDRAARGPDNLLPPILDAVRAQVTLGEICETLRGVFGVHQPSVVI